MTMNRTDFADEVCRELELLPAGQVIEPDFKAVIDKVYDARWAFLANEGLAFFPKNQIPDEMVNPLAIYIAGYAAGQLLDAQGKAEKMANIPQAIRDMTSVAGKKSVSGRVKPSYF